MRTLDEIEADIESAGAELAAIIGEFEILKRQKQEAQSALWELQKEREDLRNKELADLAWWNEQAALLKRAQA